MDSLKTTVRNISSKELFFGYLGAHGKTLTAGQEFTEDGDLLTKITASRKAPRWLASLRASLTANELAIVSTPKDHFFDLTADATKVLKVDGGNVSAEDPSWGNYSSSI